MSLPDAGLYLLLMLWGGLAAVDGTSCGQFMISRPIVAATVAGWLSGDAVAGAAVGVLLEAFHLAVLPVGAARYPEGGAPAVVAGALYALSDRLPSTLLGVLVFFLVWESVAGASVRLLRRINGRLLPRSAGGPVQVAAVERRHLGAVAIDLGRGVLLVALGLPVLSLLLWLSGEVWVVDQRIPQVAVVAALAGLTAGSLRLFGGRVRLFLAGVLVGLFSLLVRT